MLKRVRREDKDSLQRFATFVTVEPVTGILMRTSRQVWLAWFMVTVWMGVIFYASTDLFSASHTSRFIEPFLRWISQGRLSEQTVQELHFFIRKCAHITEYAILAVLACNAVWRTITSGTTNEPPKRMRSAFILAFVVAAIYAASDEFHQRFVPSRGSSVHDVVIDMAGAVVGLTILQGCRLLRRR